MSSCEKSEINKNDIKGLFIENDDLEILEWEFLEEKNKNTWEVIFESSGDFFDWAEFEDVFENNLWASILWAWEVSMDWNYFNISTWLDLHKVTWYIDFVGDPVEIQWKDYSLNPSYWDKINWLKVAFANSRTSWIFDSIAFQWYWMENISIINWKTRFDIYFDWDDKTKRAYILKNIFTSQENFYTQAKFSQEKKNWDSYVSAKIHTLVVNQVAKNEDWWLLFNWPCLKSDFTHDKNLFKNSDEVFPSDFYEDTNTWYLINSDFDWVDQWKNFEWAKCALNDTYNSLKLNVIWSQCYEWDDSWLWKKDVWRIVFRPRIDSFCTQAASIDEELNYPKYACNILTWKTLNTPDEIIQEYFWTDIVNLSWSDVNQISAWLNELNYTCWE